MATYTYLTKDSQGQRNEGEIHAASIDDAAKKLTTEGQLVIQIKEVDTSWDFIGPFLDEISLSIEKFKNRIPLSNLVFFTRQLTTMFSAGLTLERSIQGLASEEKHPKFRKVLLNVADNIRKGLNLSDALARHPGVFNSLYTALTKAGEVSGNLQEILDQLATYLENVDDTRRKVKSAMTYPAFMVFFLGAMMAGMFLFIIPMFSEVYDQLGADLPYATLVLVEISEWMSENFARLTTILVGAATGIWFISKTRRGGYFVDTLKLKTPVFGELLNQSILNKYAKTFGILLGAGVPVLDSMALLARIVDNRVYEAAVEESSDYIRDGFDISTAMRRTEAFPPIMLQLASTGEETGELSSLLDRASDYYFKQVNAMVSRMTTLIEPILILFVGVIIALMVVVTYLPVFFLGAALQSGL